MAVNTMPATLDAMRISFATSALNVTTIVFAHSLLNCFCFVSSDILTTQSLDNCAIKFLVRCLSPLLNWH